MAFDIDAMANIGDFFGSDGLSNQDIGVESGGIGGILSDIGSSLQKNPEILGFGLDALANIVDPKGIEARSLNPLSGTKLAQSSLASKAEKARGEKYGKHLSVLEELFKVLSGDDGLQSVARKKNADGGDDFTIGMRSLGEGVLTPAESERQFQSGA